MNLNSEAAKAALNTRDPALIAWARRNLECELEDMGEALNGWQRRTHSRFAPAKAEAVEWLAAIAHGAAGYAPT